MDIIKSLPVASLLSPGLADDLEVFFPEWLSTLLPFYNEARNGGDFAFHQARRIGTGLLSVAEKIPCALAASRHTGLLQRLSAADEY